MKIAFKEGQTVKAGDPLILIDPRPYQVALEQAEGALASDKALLANARVGLDRSRTLFAQDSIAEQQLLRQPLSPSTRSPPAKGLNALICRRCRSALQRK